MTIEEGVGGHPVRVSADFVLRGAGMERELLNRDDTKHWPSYVAPQVSFLFDKMVNVVFVGTQGAPDRKWTLIDAGLPTSAHRIKQAAASFFGEDSRPGA